MKESDLPDSIVSTGTLAWDNDWESNWGDVQSKLQDAGLDIDSREFARRMKSLIENAGMTASRARFRALDEQTSLTREQMGDIFDVTKGTMDATASDVQSTIKERTIGHYALFNIPMNFVAEAEFRGVGPIDTITKIYFYEYPYQKSHATPHGKQMPQYCVVTEEYGPSRYGGYDISNIDISRYHTADTVIDELYRESYFWTVDRAQEWKQLLECVYEIEIELEPEERLNPDVDDRN